MQCVVLQSTNKKLLFLISVGKMFTFLIHPFQQKTNSCLLILPSPETLNIINRSLISCVSILHRKYFTVQSTFIWLNLNIQTYLYGFPFSFLNNALQIAVNSLILMALSLENIIIIHHNIVIHNLLILIKCCKTSFHLPGNRFV